jgi:DNA-binding response OmpR family regulator
MLKLLVVEDDRMFAELIRRGLKEEGYSVDVACDVAEGRTLAFVHEYDAILLDVVLPDGTGLQLAAALRDQGRRTPILMVTGENETTDVVAGLDVGADDYLTKPFDIQELKARVRALVRRGGAQRAETLSVGDVSVDRVAHRALVGSRRMDLTPKEFSLLAFFSVHAESVVTRTELLEKVWDFHFDPGSNVVDVHIARLRAKLRRYGATARLATVRGAGFMLTARGEDADGA